MTSLPCFDEDVVTDLIAGRRRLDVEAVAHLEECPACVRLLGAAAAIVKSSSSPSLPHARDVLEPGTVLNDTYTVIRLIGRGGMGEVYEVSHVRLQGRYAVKVLRADISEDQKLISRFRREADITSALRHPNIVHVIDFDRTADGFAFLAMELLAGCDLATLLRREGPLPLDRVLRFVAQIVSALSAVHKQGIVHRDLKPENVFVLPDEDEERIKLMDFGLSKWSGDSLTQSLRLSRDQALIGTPRYMAPEQAMARNKEITPATDQFALAALVYEMLAGVPAFSADSLAELLHAIVYEKEADLRTHRKDLPPGVAQAIHRALAKAPEDRFPSVQELFRALSAPAPARATGRVALRWKVALLALMTAGGSSAAIAFWSRDEGAPPPAAVAPARAIVPAPAPAAPREPAEAATAERQSGDSPAPPRPQRRVRPRAIAARREVDAGPARAATSESPPVHPEAPAARDAAAPLPIKPDLIENL
jgi:serine/threonine-protein kinase